MMPDVIYLVDCERAGCGNVFPERRGGCGPTRRYCGAAECNRHREHAWRQAGDSWALPRDGRGIKNHPLYSRWCGMLRRCEDPSRENYRNYGARGISVCAEWHDFMTFARWIESSLGWPSDPALTLDRIDNDGNYEPGNVRWATRAEQNANQRPRLAELRQLGRAR